MIVWKINIHLHILPKIGTFVETELIMSRNTSVSLGSYFDMFVQSNLSSGRYKNASEVIRAGLRLLEEEETKIIALKNAIQEGVESEIDYNFNPKNHLKELKAKKRLNV